MGYILFVLIVLFVVSVITGLLKRKGRQKYLETYNFHSLIRGKLKKKYPELSDKQHDLIMQGLRDYFLMCFNAKKKLVSMPSQAVDEAWHAFILSTRLYENFCMRGFGYYLHHTPAEAMSTPTRAREGIKRAWRLACAKEKINPKKPVKLPLIFALDGLLHIPDGFTYTLQCDKKTAAKTGAGTGIIYCAGDIGCSSGCAGDTGADFGTDASDGGSDGGGDGGSGCGSGCGGGCGGGGD